MKILVLSLSLFCLPSLIGAPTPLSLKFPVGESLNGKTTFESAGGSMLSFVQDGDTTSIKLNNKDISLVQSPQFVRSVIQSENKQFLVALIGTHRSEIEGLTASDYHSILRISLNKDGTLKEAQPFLAKTAKPLNEPYCWIIKIDSILNDGRTIRLNYGEPKDRNDPHKEMKYVWQVRDLETAALYREEDPEKE